MSAESMAPVGAEAARIGGQIRRRREALRRCETMLDGRRDPLDKPKSTRTITVRAIGRNTVEFTGCDYAVLDAIRTLDAKRMRARGVRAWHVPQSAAEDVMALCEARGYLLEVTL